MRKITNEPKTQAQEHVQWSQNINDLTVAEAIEQGYKILNPAQQSHLAGLLRKEKAHRAIEKEFENTNFESEGRSSNSIKEVS